MVLKWIVRFVKIVAWIFQNWYIDFSETSHGFVKVCISRSLPNNTKFDQEFRACWNFCLDPNMAIFSLIFWDLQFIHFIQVSNICTFVGWDMPCITLKVFPSLVPHLFLLPSKYLQCGGFALPCYYWAQEANKEKLNIAFQYLKTKHMDSCNHLPLVTNTVLKSLLFGSL